MSSSPVSRRRSLTRAAAFVAPVALGVTVLAGTAQADEHGGGLPPHPHVLVVGVEFDATGEPVGVRNCVDLAANQALPLHVHHEHLHFGIVNQKFALHTNNVVVPTAPFPGVPWTDCASLLELFGLG